MLKQQVMQVQMNADYQSMQYQNDIIKFKMQIRELETQIKDNDKEYSKKITELKEQFSRDLRHQKEDSET